MDELYIVVGIRSEVVGTKEVASEAYNRYLEAEKSGDNDGLGWGSYVPKPDLKDMYVTKDWYEDMPVILGVYDYDPTEEWEEELGVGGKTRIYRITEKSIERRREKGGGN